MRKRNIVIQKTPLELPHPLALASFNKTVGQNPFPFPAAQRDALEDLTIAT